MAKKQDDKPKAVTALQLYAVEARDGFDVEACSTEYVCAADETQALLLYLKWFPARAIPTRAKLSLSPMPVKQIPADTKVICEEHVEDKNKDGTTFKRVILRRKRLSANSV